MKNLENTIRPIYDRVVCNINNLLMFREISSQYSTDPDATVEKLVGMDKSGDVFTDIATGLKGELTRDKSITLGKNVITMYMKDLATTCLKDIDDLYKQPMVSMDILNVNVDTLSTSVDMKSLDETMDTIKAQQLRLEYLGLKASRVISPMLAGDLGVQKDVPTYLAVAGDKVKGIDFNSVIPKAISAYNIHKKTSGVISKFVSNMVTTNTVVDSEVESMISQLDEHKVDLVDVKEEHVVLLNCVNNSSSVTLDSELYELFVEMHDELNNKLPKMTTDVNTLASNVKKIINLDILSKLLNSYIGIIDGYFKGEMTLEVMMAATKVTGIMISDAMNALVTLLNTANKEIVLVNDNINLINQVHDVDNEVILTAALSKR